MKISKSLLAALLVVGFAGAASSQTLYIAGSTSFRGSTTKAIEDCLATGFTYAYDGTGTQNEFAGGEAVFKGTIKAGLTGAGTAVEIKTYWTGSESGLIDVSTTNSITGFIPDTAATSVSPGTNVHGAYTKEADVPEVAMSDSSYKEGAASIALAPGNGTFYQNAILNAGLTDGGVTAGPKKTVGIIPWAWIAGAQTTGTVPYTNITQQAASVLMTQGYVPVSSLLSGTAIVTDTTDFAFLVGRSEDSGTRVNAEAESNPTMSTGEAPFGVSINQYYATFTANNGSVATSGSFPADDTNTAGTPLGNIQTGGTNTTVSDIGLWPSDAPVNTETAINYEAEGHSGQISGGNVASMLEGLNPLYLNLSTIDFGDGQPTSPVAWTANNSTAQVNKAYIIGYLGGADAGGIPAAAGCTYLTYNGVAFSPQNIYNGSYTFWGFEHLYYRTAGTNAISGTLKNLADDIADKIYTVDAQTDSSGNLDTNIPATNKKDGGLLYNTSITLFTKGGLGQPVTLY